MKGAKIPTLIRLGFLILVALATLGWILGGLEQLVKATSPGKGLTCIAYLDPDSHADFMPWRADSEAPYGRYQASYAPWTIFPDPTWMERGRTVGTRDLTASEPWRGDSCIAVLSFLLRNDGDQPIHVTRGTVKSRLLRKVERPRIEVGTRQDHLILRNIGWADAKSTTIQLTALSNLVEPASAQVRSYSVKGELGIMGDDPILIRLVERDRETGSLARSSRDSEWMWTIPDRAARAREALRSFRHVISASPETIRDELRNAAAPTPSIGDSNRVLVLGRVDYQDDAGRPHFYEFARTLWMETAESRPAWGFTGEPPAAVPKVSTLIDVDRPGTTRVVNIGKILNPGGTVLTHLRLASTRSAVLHLEGLVEAEGGRVAYAKPVRLETFTPRGRSHEETGSFFPD